MAAVASTGQRAAAAACAAAVVVLGIFASPALASDGTSTPPAADAAELPSGTAEAASPASGEGNDTVDAPEHQDSTSTRITQQAEAGAAAKQEGASNSTVTSAGERQAGGGVAQGNDVSAGATASADASVALEQPGAGSNGQLDDDDRDNDTPGAGRGNGNGVSTDVVPTTDLTQGVGATAEARQGGATNTSIVVRSAAPGDDGPVSQANAADATAAGSAIGRAVGNAGPSDAPSPSSHVAQDVQARAIAIQSGVANSNVSVRVGSAGDSGTVSQANTATATAAADAGEPTAATQAQSMARQDGAVNANVSVRVFSPGDDGAVTQANAAGASARAGDAAAQAEQTGVSNTNVSIRIESPGSDGGATQGSRSATAADGPEGGAKMVDVESRNGNTDVRIRVNGPDLADPTGASAGLVSVWRWTWQWDYDETLGLPLDVDHAGSGWNWDWSGDGASVTSVPLTPDLAVGSFVWSWDWERAGDWTWTPDLSARLSCRCIWIWDWSWTWKGSGVEVAGAASAAPAATPAAVEQQNVISAVAEASVLADVAQASTHDYEDPGTSFAGQLVDLTQLAAADASAVQSDTLNELVTPGTQANVARADALALGGALVKQGLVQARAGPVETSQWAGQQVGLGQLLVAQAAAAQSDARNLGSSQTTLAAADAEVMAHADTAQQLDQLGLSVGGRQDQWAGQQTSVVQTAGGVALVGQAAARDGASALATSSAAVKATTIQGAEQKAIGGFGLRSQRSAQLVVLDQVGTSTATTTTDSTSGQTNREASSKAMTRNDGLVEQRAAQELTEAGSISIQDATQATLLVQVADAYSPSLGGTAGTATVVNCAAVGQASGQAMGGAPAVVDTADHSTFCFPPEPTTTPVEPGEEGQTPDAPEPAAAADPGQEGQTLDAGVQATTIVQSSVVLAAALDVEPRGGYGVYVGVDQGARPELSAARGYARSSSLTAGGPLAPPLGAFALVARTPQISAAIVSASPSGHDSKAAVRDHTEQPLQWPCGLLTGVGSASSIVPGGGDMAATMVASPASSTGCRVVAGSVVKRPTHFTLRLERPG